MGSNESGVKKVLSFILKLFKKKWFIALFVIVVLIIVIKVAAQAKREMDSRVIDVPVATEDTRTSAEIQAQALVDKYGTPPDGFEWDLSGNLVAVGDSNKTPEDVGYAYIRALSQLDFSTASKYSSTAVISRNYNAMYEVQTSVGASQFVRNLYKEVLMSIEINEIESVAVFDDGRYVLTFNLSLLDLTNKDFWLKDKEDIFNTLYSFSISERDTTKANQFLYDYLIDYYSSDDALKRDVKVDIIVDASSNNSWLVSKDLDLDALCRYQNSAVVSEYIWSCYTTWVNNNR